MGRAPCCDKANVKRGPWSPEEDEILKSYIEQHGTGGNWISLPSKAGLRRCGKSCRLRWLNYLRPDIRHGKFTEEEDRVIFSLYNEIGSRWSIIAAKLHGRTDNDVKNHWNTKLKKLLKNSVADIFSSSAAHSYSVSSNHERCSFDKFLNSKTETHQESLSAMPNLLPEYSSSFTFVHHDPGCFVLPTGLIKPDHASDGLSSAGYPSWADGGGSGMEESGFLIDILNCGGGINYGCHLFQSSIDNADQNSTRTASTPSFSAIVGDCIYDFKPQSGLIDQH